MTNTPGSRDARLLTRTAEMVWETDSVFRRVLGVAAVAAIVYSIGASKTMGNSGHGLVVLILTIVAAAVFLVWVVFRWMSPRTSALALILMGVVGAVLGGAAPGPAIYFPLVAIFSAGRRLPTRTAVVCSLSSIVAFGGTALVTGSMNGFAMLGVIAGMAAAALGGLNRAAQNRVQEQAELIVAEGQVITEERARSAALAERARIAREIHDVLAHSLSGLMVQLEAAHLLLAQDASSDQVAGHVDRARGLARSGLEETRRALQTLRGESPPIQDLLTELVETYRTDTGCPAKLTVTGTSRPLEAEAAITVYRVAQEALTNTRRHAPGARAVIDVRYEKESVLLTVTDHRADGPPAASTSMSAVGGGYGLIGMRERAELLGGTLSAGHTADGWRVALRVPA